MCVQAVHQYPQTTHVHYPCTPTYITHIHHPYTPPIYTTHIHHPKTHPQNNKREVHKSVQLRKSKCLLVAPNVEEADGPHAPSTSLATILHSAAEHDIPVVFTLTRKKLAQASSVRGGVSVVAVLDASGAEQVLWDVLALAQQVGGCVRDQASVSWYTLYTLGHRGGVSTCKGAADLY